MTKPTYTPLPAVAETRPAGHTPPQPSVAEALLDALDGVDATTPGGSLIFLIVGGLIETEIELRDLPGVATPEAD